MKKIFVLGGLLVTALFANAQQRLVLYEEFSGENCDPCAETNPDFWNFLNQPANISNVILLKYPVNIPQDAVHPLFDQNPAEATARANYYSITFAPEGRIDGRVHHANEDYPGHPAYFLEPGAQDTMNAEMNIPSAFNIIVTPTVTGTTLSATIQVNAVAPFTGTNMRLHTALVEGLHFDTPPGSNGEVDFHNTMRKMYPTSEGQTFPNTWTNGQSQLFTVTGTIPAYVDRTANSLFLVVWIQDNANKRIAQAAKSANLPLPQNDVRSESVTVPGMMDHLNCNLSGIAPKITIKNTGTNALTSADIYYRAGTRSTVNTQPWSMQTWNGNLAPNASTDVTITTPAPGAAGLLYVQDSVAMPNGITDINPANNRSSTKLSMVASSNGQDLPVSSDFESQPENWVPYATIGNDPIVIASYRYGSIGYNRSNYFLYYNGSSHTTSQSGFMILPFTNIPSGPKAIDFYVSYAQISANTSNNEQLEVVYSTDCGQSWVSVWSQAGANLATTAPTYQLLPSDNSQWAKRSVDMTAVPANAQVAFKATGGNGNNLFIDDVNFRTGAATGIEELVSSGNAYVFPNPATNQINVELNMVKAAKVSFRIVNMLGQQVGQQLTKDIYTGKTVTAIETNHLAPGIYFINIVTDKGNIQQKFVKE